MKIVVIGPVYPYKTGLSYYVSLLYNQLKKNNEVCLLSYTMQYPKFLYKKPQKDYEDDVLKVDEAEYVLNTANVFSCIATAKRIKQEKPDLVIFQWLHPYFAPCYSIICKFLKQTKILFMCHNVFPHERFPMDKFLTRITLKNGNIFTVHAQSDADDLKSILPNAKIGITVHPAYNFFKQKNLTKKQARDIIGIGEEEKVLLFFGLVREYKGLKHLLNAMKILIDRGEQGLRLVVAGDFADKKEEYNEMISELGIGTFLSITDGHIPICEVEKFFVASDLVVLPYESATQSGVIQVAYSFDKPVLATNVGGLPDVVFDGITGYVVEPFRPDLIADAIIDFFNNNKAEELSKGVNDEKYRYSWERMEEVIMDLYND